MGLFRQNMKKLKILKLSRDSRYFRNWLLRAKHSPSHHLAGLSVGSTRYCLCRPLQSKEEIGNLFAAAHLCRLTYAGSSEQATILTNVSQ